MQAGVSRLPVGQNRVGQIGEGSCMVAQIQVELAAGPVGGDMVGLLLDRRAGVSQRRLQVTERKVNLPAAIVCVGLGEVEFQRPVQVREGPARSVPADKQSHPADNRDRPGRAQAGWPGPG